MPASHVWYFPASSSSWQRELALGAGKGFPSLSLKTGFKSSTSRLACLKIRCFFSVKKLLNVLAQPGQSVVKVLLSEVAMISSWSSSVMVQCAVYLGGRMHQREIILPDYSVNNGGF